ncbi:MAG: lysozyme [Clostridiaceae bacterium]|nr:lysozyme [Clostridiaceae bacterium]
MKTSQNGINFIKRHEGLRLKAYQDVAGVWTIGYGSTGGVREGDTINEVQAETLLSEDLRTAEREVNRHKLNINQNQFDALVSFAFNIGTGAFRNSTLLKRIKIDVNHPDIPNQFNRWIYGGGKVLPGLVRRRNEEAKLYFT